MLDPRDRTLLLENFRPPDGFKLDKAIGTSYSLDLLALLTAPLAFTFFDWEDDDGHHTGDPIALLESLRRHARQMYLFCQAGEIKLPPPSQRLVAFLERTVIPVTLPADSAGRPAIFHPKVWLLRYVADAEPVRYRLICATRNLTFDRSWDIALCVEGELKDRTRAISEAKPLGDFIAALPTLASTPMATEAKAEIERIADEVRRVKFELPEDIEGIEFWPLGIEGHRRTPFEGGTGPLLVMAPFVSAPLLDELSRDRAGACTLISRPEELAALPQGALQTFGSVYALTSEACDPEDDRHEAQRSELSGLHAKAFIEDDGWYASLFVGSANATSAAFSRNVEFLVELRGKKRKLGIEAILGEHGTKSGIRPLLQPWQPGALTLSEEELASRALDDELAALRRLISEQPFQLRCVPESGDSKRYFVELSTRAALPERLHGRLTCWLTTQSQEDGKNIGSTDGLLARFGPLDLSSLSAFIAFRVSASLEGVQRESRFVLNVPIEGLPEDRLDRLLASHIRDRDRLLRLLLLLLQPDGSATALADAISGDESGKQSRSREFESVPIFEVLVRATVDGKERLERMKHLLTDLQRTDEGRSLIPEPLLALWKEVTDHLRGSDERASAA